jgi:hypothetical protein
MTLRRAWIIAACGLAAAVAPAAAQFPPVGGLPPGQFGPAPAQQAAPQVQQQEPPCITEFMRLRGDTDKKGKALRAASERHASTKEACGLFNSFTVSEDKLIKYATANAQWCGIPTNIIDQMKQSHGRAMEMRTKVCAAAARPHMQPHVPTLSDALGAPVTDSSNIKTGRGTFDTLTGTPLGSK